MDAIDFFAIAERYQSSRIEAECRTSIGRSYYALFKNRADYDMTAAMRSKTSEFVYQKAIKAMNEFQSIAPPDLELIVERIQAMP